MNPRQAIALKMEILRALDLQGLCMPQETLWNQIRLVVAPVPLLGEFREALETLEARKLVVGVRDRLEPLVVKWVLTDNGKAELLSHE